MDILDIDEALKDDSFIFLADKTHDDVSNILQQWKTNNSGLSTQQNEQTYKLNSKTFTRPKRKSTSSLENQFSTASQQQQQMPPIFGLQHGTTPLLNLEIGGFVTNMHKSFLQDTSPPPSILSSMELSMERMNNSLITSADFTNLNFLQSTQSLEFGNNENDLTPAFNFSSKASADGYTLSDMIRDRKALESLTMSGDGTLIKDSHIAQIDDISLTLSKTASGCSTMDNSTDSVGIVGSTCGGVECSNQNIEINSQRQHPHKQEGVANVLMKHSMVLSDEMIGDMTFNLVENSIHGNSSALNITHDLVKAQPPSTLGVENKTFKKTVVPFDETMLVNNNNNNNNKINATFEYQPEDLAPGGRCETPENIDKTMTAMRFCESTPQTTSMRHPRHSNKQQYTPTIKLTEDVNISPIVAQKFYGQSHNETRVLLNNTYGTTQPLPTSETVLKPTGLPQFSETLDILDEIEIGSPNGTYNKLHMNIERETTSQQQQVEDARKQMQCVMDLAEAEVELLAQQNDEEQFEDMLDKLGRVQLNAEQLKMQKSLECIKKRFNYNGANNSSSYPTSKREISREAQDMRDLTQHMQELVGEDLAAGSQETMNVTMDLNEPTAGQGARGCHKEANSGIELKSSRELSTLTSGSPHTSSTSSMLNGQSGERLLSRRSRLYDDVNLSMLSSSNGSNLSAKSSANSTSFTVQKNSELATTERQDDNETEAKLAQETEEPSKPMPAASEMATCYRLTEKRERDRDRFKTIKITKQRTEVVVGADGTELNVPCIDGDDEHTKVDIDTNEVGGLGCADNCVGASEGQQTVHIPQQRFSRRDRNTPEVFFDNNKLEVEQCKGSAGHPNYLTYKKPKEKLSKRNLPEILAPPLSECGMPKTASITRLEPRSLSRPRYISGLQKFSVVSKATSAGDLPKTSTAKTTNVYGKSAQTQNRIQSKNAAEALSGQGELKSPMGIKSKSFHNLSSNFGLGSSSGLTAPRASLSYGLRKLNNGTSSNTSLDKQSKLGAFRAPTTSYAPATERNDDGVFKVPKLGLRAPHAVSSGAGNVKRGIAAGGLARPSSGYYSMNVTGNKTTSTQQQSAMEVEIEPTGRHSPTESLSSASSRGSLYGIGVGIGAGAGNAAKQTIGNGSKALDTNALLTAKLTQVTTGATGIPKPSGLRQPSNIKRSGLPRPSSIVRR